MCGETDIIFVYLKLTNGQLVLIFRRRKTQQVFWPRHMFFEPCVALKWPRVVLCCVVWTSSVDSISASVVHVFALEVYDSIEKIPEAPVRPQSNN